MTEDPAGHAALWREPWRRRFRKFSVPVAAAEAAAVLFSCASPLIQRTLIDGIQAHELNQIMFAAVLLAAVMIGAWGGRAAGRWLRGLFAVRVRVEYKSAMFRRLLNLPDGFLKSRGTGYFFNRLQNDAVEISDFTAGIGISVWIELLKLLLAFAVIAVMMRAAALLLLPFLAAQSLAYFKCRRNQYRLSRRVQECIARERAVMQDHLSAHTLLKTHAAAEPAQNRIKSGLARWETLMRGRLGNENRFYFLLQIPVWCCIAGTAVFGIARIMQNLWTFGDLWAQLGLLMLAFAPTRTLGCAFVQMQSASSAWTRLRELRDADGEDGPLRRPPDRLNGDIVFDSVDFSYPDGGAVLRNLRLTVPGGGVLFLTGTNGCGKSTILSLLLRLYEPARGTISIGGVPVGAYDLAPYRLKIGYIGQRPAFIRGTLRDNLLMGIRRSDSDILAVFRGLNCLSLLDSRPGGLNSQVMENGDNFSGGQRLRLALVRELLRDTDILLLDEACANLDDEGKALFYSLVLSLNGKKTVLAVTHESPGDSFPVFRMPHWNGCPQ